MATALYELSRQECEDLLRVGTTARIAFLAPDGPHIVPMNYAVIGHDVVLRTSSSSLLGIHAPGSVVALEIDGLDGAREQGWSVVLRGMATTVDDPSTLAALLASGRPRPWVLGRRLRYLRIPWNELSGRRIGAGWSVVGTWPFRLPWSASLSRPEPDEGFPPMPAVPRRRPW